MKKKILHVIYDLGRGGAETMLVQVIAALPEFEHTLVTLCPDNQFKKELQAVEVICLNMPSVIQFPLYIQKLKRLVAKRNPDLVHTHLFWPTIMSRMAVPKRIPLISTIHAFIATSVEYKKWYIRFLDQFSYKQRDSIIIGVAQGATTEYFKFLNLKPKTHYCLYTFVDLNKFSKKAIPSSNSRNPFKLISIGALRVQKNQQFLIDAMELLKEYPVELDIYGSGPLQQELNQLIEQKKVAVTLKGQLASIETVLPDYDLFVMSSTFEGFSLAVLEAMASKVPLLLSDIESFREQCVDTALYFNLANPNDFKQKLIRLMEDASMRNLNSELAYQRVVDNFTLQKHIQGIRTIYSDALI